MKWTVEILASERPEEWARLRGLGGNSLSFPDEDAAVRAAAVVMKQQPHVTVRVAVVHG